MHASSPSLALSNFPSSSNPTHNSDLQQLDNDLDYTNATYTNSQHFLPSCFHLPRSLSPRPSTSSSFHDYTPPTHTPPRIAPHPTLQASQAPFLFPPSIHVMSHAVSTDPAAMPHPDASQALHFSADNDELITDFLQEFEDLVSPTRGDKTLRQAF